MKTHSMSNSTPSLREFSTKPICSALSKTSSVFPVPMQRFWEPIINHFAVRKAVASTAKATQTDGRGDVFWHTQGSGKSLTMVFYAHLLQLVLCAPTILVLTDRNDLDDQLVRAVCQMFRLPALDAPAGGKPRSSEKTSSEKRS